MTRLRHHVRMRRGALPLMLLAVLLARLAAPAGFMPSGFAIVPCSGHGVLRAVRPMHHMAGYDAHAGHDQGEGGHADAPCGFGGLAMPGMAGADPVLPALAIAFVVATAAFLPPLAPVRRASRWRPPLRAPPIPA